MIEAIVRTTKENQYAAPPKNDQSSIMEPNNFVTSVMQNSFIAIFNSITKDGGWLRIIFILLVISLVSGSAMGVVCFIAYSRFDPRLSG